MSTLHLTLKKKWFDMIASGEKPEEYREIKLYWIRRFIQAHYQHYTAAYIRLAFYEGRNIFNSFEYVTFRNGYSKKAPSITVECLGIEIGPARPEWSDNWQGEAFIIKLGKII